MSDNRHDWVARSKHLEGLQSQFAAANAKIACEYIGNVLTCAQKMVAAFGDCTPASVRMMLIDQYNVAWLEYLTQHLRPVN